MKKLLIIAGFLATSVSMLQAQTPMWSVNGSNLYVPISINVGMGTDDPAAKLFINGGDLGFNQPNNMTYGIIWKNGSYAKTSAAIKPVDFGHYARQGLGFFTGDFEDKETDAVERMRITRTGNIGIGTDDPVTKLFINGGDLGFNQPNNMTYGIIWKNGSYAKTSAAIQPVDFSHYARQGLGFFTGDFEDSETDAVERMRITRAGNIGIGTDDPEAKLQVNAEGNPANLEHNVNNGFMIKGNDHVLYMGVNTDTHVGNIQSVDYDTTTSPLLLNAKGGYVGINTMSPQYALDVKGEIRATKMRVESIDNFADFVFADDYKLRPLSEVKSHIDSYGHLPEIPTAAEVQENGIELAEMQVKLLQKIEELTLYIIDLNGQIEELKNK